MQSLAYGFVLSMWIQKRVNEAFVRKQFTDGRLTEQEVEIILGTPQNI
mgnify:CR=1 FL=1